MRRLILSGLIALWPALASAQFATIAATPPTSDNGDRIATTAWVNNFVNAGLPLASGKIWIGSVGNIATAQTPSGDLTVSNAGVFTFGTVNANVGSFGSATLCPTVTVNAKGLITAASAATCTPAIGSITGLGANVATFLATPTTANLAAAVTGETGTGALVFGTSPAITTPTGIVKGDVGLGNVANVDTTNAANISSGALPAGRLPALTGDCTTTIGTVATTCTKINGVDQTTAWSSFTPSPVCGTATFTVTSARSKALGKTIFWELDTTITAIGTCTNALSATGPVIAQSGGSAGGRETAVSGLNFNCNIPTGSATISCSPPSGNFALNNRLVISGVYESQ